MNTCSLQGWFSILQNWYTGFDLIQLFFLTPTRNVFRITKEDDDTKGREEQWEGIKLLRNSVPPSRVSQRSASVRPLPAGRSYSDHRAKFVLFLPARWCEKWEERSDEKATKDQTELGDIGVYFLFSDEMVEFLSREIYMIRILVQLKDGIRKRCTDLDSPPIGRLLFGILSRRLALLPAFD
jgi:hypothetical protein